MPQSSGRRWRQLNTQTPRPSPPLPTTSGTCARHHRRPSPRRHPPGTSPGLPTTAAATAAGTTTAAHHPAATAAGHRRPTPILRLITTEFAGITTNSSINLTDAFPLAAGRETVCPPNEETLHREETAEIKTATAMSFSHGSGYYF
jgi:hypothetical protein